MPRRIQRKRSKGWKMPGNAVYVGRPSIFGNPFKGTENTREVNVRMFRSWLNGVKGTGGGGLRRISVISQLDKLRGKDLACWCKLSDPCHADVLLEIANA